jgi:uncharacterized protein (TIGR01777 family)
MNKKRVILAGGSGFLGNRLAQELIARDYDVIILTRNPRGSGQFQWDGKTVGAWGRELDGAYAVVNVAGSNVNCRYTPAKRREIVDSRVDSVHAIGKAIAACANPPKVWVQASSLAIYGNTHDRWCDENAPHGSGFPVETCQLWEEALRAQNTPRTRKVVLRIGFVLDAGRGALATLEKLVRCFLGGRVSNGHQYISWIHWRDMNEMFRLAIERDDIEGVFNATAPEPVTNAELMARLRKALHRPWCPPAPAWAVHIGAFFMGTEPMLALTGRRCAPKGFVEKNFAFRFAELEAALGDIYK